MIQLYLHCYVTTFWALAYPGYTIFYVASLNTRERNEISVLKGLINEVKWVFKRKNMLQVKIISFSVPLGKFSVLLVENWTVFWRNPEFLLSLCDRGIPVFVHFNIVQNHQNFLRRNGQSQLHLKLALIGLVSVN